MIEWFRSLFGHSKRPAVDPIPIPLPDLAHFQSEKKEDSDEERQLKASILEGTAPAGLRLRTLNLSGVKQPFTLPADLQCFSLNLTGSAVRELPADLSVEFRINLTDCAELTSLPRGLKTGSLMATRCRKLAALPEDLDVNFLTIEGCTALAEWPESARVSMGFLNARDCQSLATLPQGLGPLTNLDLSGCRQISSLPPNLKVSGWIDVAGTRLVGLSESLRHARLRWRGVNINARIAFFPETITAPEILGERNAEVRRVMLERRGIEQFMREADAKVLDEDTDPGGKRQLLKVPMADDEDLVCVSVHCPSTGRHYIIRVPPTVQTCREAVAWTAGYDRASDYNPITET
jgi:hypothetical protein